MRTLPVALVLLAPTWMMAAVPPLPSFPAGRIELPPLSFAESAKETLTSRIFSGNPFVDNGPSASPMRSQAPRKVSRMPVITPRASGDAGMVVPPAPGVDYKLEVKVPDVESVK